MSEKNKFALISVTLKTGVEKLASFLVKKGYTIISTGGTYRYLSQYLTEDKDLIEVSVLTGFPEILDGRVKTLHPAIHGGILASNRNSSHQKQLSDLGMVNIEAVVVNLYQFSKGINKDGGITDEEATELIDIGGHTLLRAAAKNYFKTLVVVDSDDYYKVVTEWDQIGVAFRRRMATKAYQHVADYDKAIVQYFSENDDKTTVTRQYRKEFDLKYGCNPHQGLSGVYSLLIDGDFGETSPFKLINGLPGYINLLDALGAWNLVRELRNELDLPAAASFKHTSPAGVGLGVELNDTLQRVYGVVGKELSGLATAFARARNSDPLSSFGDFIALSDIVDLSTAKLISREVSDGVIAPGYDKDALEILKKKRGGKYLILQANPDWTWDKELQTQYREMPGGVVLCQEVDTAVVGKELVKKEAVVVDRMDCFSEEIRRDLILANITLKYTQSNSVAYACGGQVIGVGAGQQNRVDCVKLAGWKSETWVLRQMPVVLKILEEGFKDGVKKQEKVNAIYDYLEMCRKFAQYYEWELDQSGGGKFKEPVDFLGMDMRREYCNKYYDENKIVMASDAFFPFPDNILAAARYGVKFISQPGGSMADEIVKAECHKKNIGLLHTGTRVFTH